MNPGVYNLPNMVQGDTWDGISVVLTVDDIAPTVPLQLVHMTFQADPQAEPTVTLYSPGDITINDAATWDITVPAQKLNLPVGTFHYSLRFMDTNSNLKTYLTGTLTLS